jgi:putative phosphoribosyl transferase
MVIRIEPDGTSSRTVGISCGDKELIGDLTIPAGASGLVVFAHGSGSSRFSARNRAVALALQNRGLGTLLLDLLTTSEEMWDEATRHLRFDIPFLAHRLVVTTDWLTREFAAAPMDIGYFGASTGAAAALVAAAERPHIVRAVVSRGGRPDLAAEALPRVTAPTLLIVGGNDGVVVDLNREAFDLLRATKTLEIVPGATHLFAEPGALEQVARLAGDWFVRHLAGVTSPAPR